MKNFLTPLFLLIILLDTQFLHTQTNEPICSWKYPFIKTDTIKDYYFGKEVIDPYRILEELENEKVKSWLREQNRLYDTIIYSISTFDSLYNEISIMQEKKNKWTFEPRIAGKRVFYPSGFWPLLLFLYTRSLCRSPA